MSRQPLCPLLILIHTFARGSEQSQCSAQISNRVGCAAVIGHTLLQAVVEDDEISQEHIWMLTAAMPTANLATSTMTWKGLTRAQLRHILQAIQQYTLGCKGEVNLSMELLRQSPCPAFAPVLACSQPQANSSVVRAPPG